MRPIDSTELVPAPSVDMLPDNLREAVAELRERVDGEVRFDAGSRAAYSTDASNHRQVPIDVVVPGSIDAALEAVRLCRELDLPIANRVGSTSLTGLCTNMARAASYGRSSRRGVHRPSTSRSP